MKSVAPRALANLALPGFLSIAMICPVLAMTAPWINDMPIPPSPLQVLLLY